MRCSQNYDPRLPAASSCPCWHPSCKPEREPNWQLFAFVRCIFRWNEFPDSTCKNQMGRWNWRERRKAELTFWQLLAALLAGCALGPQRQGVCLSTQAKDAISGQKLPKVKIHSESIMQTIFAIQILYWGRRCKLNKCIFSIKRKLRYISEIWQHLTCSHSVVFLLVLCFHNPLYFKGN